MTARATPVPAAEPSATVGAGSPLERLRELRRTGLDGQVTWLRHVIEEISDPFELESAGRMLSAERVMAELRAAGTLRDTALVVYGNSTLDAMPPLLAASLVRDGVLAHVGLAGLTAWKTDVLAGAADFAHLAPAPVVLILDDDVVFDEVREPAELDAVLDACARLPARLALWVERVKEIFGSLLVLTTVPLGALRRDTVVDYRGKARLDAGWARMNAEILDLGEPARGVVAISHEGVAAHAGCLFESDRMRHIAGARFDIAYLAALAAEISRIVVAQLGMTSKCLVLDLDNTLWGGVLADDGIGELAIGGGYPGSAHLELQRLALSLAAQGVMLAVASKNVEDVAVSAMSSHPEMTLRPEHVLAHRIDFSPKPSGLRSIAAALNIGTDALVFVDDSAVERGLMRAMAPEVAVVETGSDPAGFASTLARRGLFNVLERTNEDTSRAASYQAAGQRRQLLDDAASLESYLEGLDSRLTLSAAAPLHVGRTAQLFGKTNQFNLTGLRYTVDDVRGPRRHDATRFVVGRLTDRFGDSGLIVAAAIREADGETWSIDNLVLSCRAFSRDVETAMLAEIVAAAAAAGMRHVCGRFVPSAKNGLVADFFERHGFEQVGTVDAGATTAWRLATDTPVSVPTWISAADGEEAFRVA